MPNESAEPSRSEVRITLRQNDDQPTYSYEAFTAFDAWAGTVTADNAEAAIHETLCDCWRQRPKLAKKPINAVVDAPRGKIMPQYLPELEALHPGLSLTLHKGSISNLLASIPKSSVRNRLPTTESDLPPVIVATDGSVRGDITGFGWLASTGDFNMTGFRHNSRQMGYDLPLVAELRAIDDAVRALSQHRHITIITDSQNAVDMVTAWMQGSMLLPPGYNTDKRKKGRPPGLIAARSRIHQDRQRISISWTRGHTGEPLNEGADALARLASRNHLPGSDLTLTQYRTRAAELAKSFTAAYIATTAATETQSHSGESRSSAPH